MKNLHHWLRTPAGQYLLQWEANHFDAAVADIFGYHALQLGLPEVDSLATNRMPHRWLGLHTMPATHDTPEPATTDRAQAASAGPTPAPASPPPAIARLALAADPAALPFAEASLDLITLPHTLEFSAAPRASLREVQRVLVPEGKVVIAGLNPVSLWGLRLRHMPHDDQAGAAAQPGGSGLISHWRLRDWLHLLGFEVDSLHFGCWRPVVRSPRGLARWAWMDSLGARWWPVFGAAYFMVASKRVHGARLISPRWKTEPIAVGKAAGLTPQRQGNSRCSKVQDRAA